MPSTRREFLLVAGAAAAGASTVKRLLVEDRGLAGRELVRGLESLRLPAEVRFIEAGAGGATGDMVFRLRVEPGRPGDTEAYEIGRTDGEVRLAGSGERGLLYAVFDFLERQGAVFGIDGSSYPIEAARALRLPAEGQSWKGKPRFAVRGLLPWPDFLNCITVYNEEDFLSYFESMLRMRCNMFGMHVYTGPDQWAESYLSFELAGAGHIAYLDTTATRRWGYLPVRTSRFGMGAPQLYDAEVFGSDATRLSRGPWETADATRALLRRAFAYAKQLGIRTGIGFEPYQIPDEIWRALPPEVRPRGPGNHRGIPGKFDIESFTAKKMLETRLAALLEEYPDAGYVWLWEDEQMNWESRRTGVPLSVTPFRQAHDFLRRHAPDKRLVLAGWGGVARHFEHFHRKLPGDVIFSCLNDSVGWDPVSEAFGKLEDRERWPIPWLEDDPGMWQAQFHAHRFQGDIDRAADFGCQGMLGIHWRSRIVDPTAGYFTRALWNKRLTPAAWYQDYARTQAAGDRVGRLATVLDGVDRDRTILSTGTGEVKDGHAVTRAFSGDYSEAFAYWADYEPEPAVMASQQRVLEQLRELVAGAASEFEREKLGYLAGHVEFLVPYAECWRTAHRLHGVLAKAARLREAGEKKAARELVRERGAPLWLELAPEVRRAVLAFQRIVATRSDLGTLASMHIKFVRLALHRLPLSIAEYLGEIPPEMERGVAGALRPDAEAEPRLFVPTRPGLLEKRTKTRITIVATGVERITEVTLHIRARAETSWKSSPAELLGRKTYQAFLGPFPEAAGLAEYYVSALSGEQKLTAPPGAPARHFDISIV